MTETRYYEDDLHNWGEWQKQTRQRQCLRCHVIQSEKEHEQFRWTERPTETAGVQLVSLGAVRGGEMVAAMTTVNGEIISQMEYGGAFYTAEQCAEMRRAGRLQ